jgi:hypothetical protein
MMTPLQRLIAGFDKGDGGLEGGKGPAFGGGNGGVAHHFLGEGLVGFQGGSRLGGSKGLDSLFFQGIDQAEGQRVFRADDHEVCLKLLGGFYQGRDVVGLDGQKVAEGGHARVARGDEESRAAGRLFDFPGEGMFAAAGTDEENIHKNHEAKSSKTKAPADAGETGHDSLGVPLKRTIAVLGAGSFRRGRL